MIPEKYLKGENWAPKEIIELNRLRREHQAMKDLVLNKIEGAKADYIASSNYRIGRALRIRLPNGEVKESKAGPEPEQLAFEEVTTAIPAAPSKFSVGQTVLTPKGVGKVKTIDSSDSTLFVEFPFAHSGWQKQDVCKILRAPSLGESWGDAKYGRIDRFEGENWG